MVRWNWFWFKVEHIIRSSIRHMSIRNSWRRCSRVVIFGFVGWGAETHGNGVGEIWNCEGDGGDDICCDKGSETKGFYVVGFIVGDWGGGGSRIGSKLMGWGEGGGWVGKILSEIMES